MTRQEMINTLEEIKNKLALGNNDELTDYTRKWTYIFVDQAIGRRTILRRVIYMTFKEQLKIANDNDLSIIDLEIANECDCVFDFDYTDDDFEALCGVIRTAYLKAEEMTIIALVQCVSDLITDKNYTVQQVLDVTTWDLIEKASWYC